MPALLKPGVWRRRQFKFGLSPKSKVNVTNVRVPKLSGLGHRLKDNALIRGLTPQLAELLPKLLV